MRLFLLSITIALTLITASFALDFPGPVCGEAEVTVSDDGIIIQNNVIYMSYNLYDGKISPNCTVNKMTGSTLLGRETQCFEIALKDNQTIKSGDLEIKKYYTRDIKGNKNAARFAERMGGKEVVLLMACPQFATDLEFRIILTDGANYVRLALAINPDDKLDIKNIILAELTAEGAKIAGTVDGSPVVNDGFFFGCENPMMRSEILDETTGHFRCSLPQSRTITHQKPMTSSAVTGVYPEGQLRRAFLYYVEMERAHPYRPWLHYLSWFDITLDMHLPTRRIIESDCLDSVQQFCTNLIEKRNVKMDSFVFDDGWDDRSSLWQFSEDFPQGFSNLEKLASSYDAGLGAWLSPWGGYSESKKARIAYGKTQGFETNEQGFSMAGPKYYKRFRDVCINMIEEYGMNYFKFDGIGKASFKNSGAGKYIDDIDAELQLIAELRKVKPDVFMNVTVGTWPSPWWLWHSDCVWRDGYDWHSTGPGSERQGWIKYRTAVCYKNVVQRAPLYPFSSLKMSGIVLAKIGYPHKPTHDPAVMDANEAELTNDIRIVFGSGICLQELFVSPSLMTERTWDALAEASKWSRHNADVLVDSHWIGGDPGKGEVFGWASWSPRKGILCIYNPSDKPGQISIDAEKAFELPKDSAKSYSVKSPWKEDKDVEAFIIKAAKKHIFKFQPFELKVLEAMPL